MVLRNLQTALTSLGHCTPLARLDCCGVPVIVRNFPFLLRALHLRNGAPLGHGHSCRGK